MLAVPLRADSFFPYNLNAVIAVKHPRLMFINPVFRFGGEVDSEGDGGFEVLELVAVVQQLPLLRAGFLAVIILQYQFYQKRLLLQGQIGLYLLRLFGRDFDLSTRSPYCQALQLKRLVKLTMPIHLSR